jgi:RHS repeat-associated protein
VYDCAGLMTSEEFDFKGNLLRTTRRLAEDYTEDPDWSAAKDDDAPGAILTASSGQLLNEAFETSVAYDALNRVTSKTTPDGSVTRHVYNEANLLEEVHVSVRGGGEQPVITNLDYNARGQRALCVYANGTTTEYVYDEETFRLRSLETTRTSPANTLQKLLYTYDPVGNITELQDQADTAPFFGTTTPVSGDGKYEYDALYRLTYAEGREHPGQQVWPAEEQYQLPHPNDLQALVRYEERYAYDEVGNIDSVTHVPDGAGGWTREYTYAQGSNRLLSTSVPGHPLATASYEYDAHGSMIEMPHLPVIQWDYADRLRHADKLGGGDVYYTYDAAGQRVRKVYVHGSTIEERIYLDGYEVYRKHTGTIGGSAEEERQTLHVMDDQRRIAMVETKTWENDVEVGTPVSRWLYQLENHLGSSSMELDHLGAVVSYEEYHPYGTTALHTPRGGAEVSAKRYRYTGKERDEETGLYYHGARYYAPWLGRWAAADPLGLAEPGRPDLNLYGYVRGKPVVFNDPAGYQDVHPAPVPGVSPPTGDPHRR